MVEVGPSGPLEVRDLSELRISRERVSDTVLSIKLRGGTEVYLFRGTGTPLPSLDKLYHGGPNRDLQVPREDHTDGSIVTGSGQYYS
jgi:hypothetical protein